jgi:hypothetical protein
MLALSTGVILNSLLITTRRFSHCLCSKAHNRQCCMLQRIAAHLCLLLPIHHYVHVCDLYIIQIEAVPTLPVPALHIQAAVGSVATAVKLYTVYTVTCAPCASTCSGSFYLEYDGEH